jgi:hypothetical protein
VVKVLLDEIVVTEMAKRKNSLCPVLGCGRTKDLDYLVCWTCHKSHGSDLARQVKGRIYAIKDVKDPLWRDREEAFFCCLDTLKMLDADIQDYAEALSLMRNLSTLRSLSAEDKQVAMDRAWIEYSAARHRERVRLSYAVRLIRHAYQGLPAPADGFEAIRDLWSRQLDVKASMLTTTDEATIHLRHSEIRLAFYQVFGRAFRTQVMPKESGAKHTKRVGTGSVCQYRR